VNVAGCWRQPYFPLHHLVGQQLNDLGLLMRGEIIWDKGASVGVSTAWGSFASASNPTLRDVHEYILVFSKGDFALPNATGRKSDITNDEFVSWTRSVWQFGTESANRVGHPAPFPVALPRRLIQLYSFPEDIVLDPFAGSGTTCVAAKQLGRRWIGVDIDPTYIRIAERRLSQEVLQLET
jgi:site-specific DNA-methyltransferase (adenine-specific)